jgi:anti-sigma regulatory factor (Ser/Thr protein kinase)
MDSNLTWLRLPAEMASLGPFTDFVRSGARTAGFAESALGKLDLILEEVVTNVFRHAYPDGEAGVAAVGYWVSGPGSLLVEVRDSGLAFNPLEAPAPDLSLGLDERPIGGLGVFLVKTLAESVAYERQNGENVLSFRIKH